ncbi:MAG: uroporphyrinogen-III synthase [Halanaerobiales bacterium]
MTLLFQLCIVPRRIIYLFTSPSTVESYSRIIKDGDDYLTKIPAVCIGPVTVDAATEVGLNVIAEAKVHSVEGLFSSLVSEIARKNEINV